MTIQTRNWYEAKSTGFWMFDWTTQQRASGHVLAAIEYDKYAWSHTWKIVIIQKNSHPIEDSLGFQLLSHKLMTWLKPFCHVNYAILYSIHILNHQCTTVPTRIAVSRNGEQRPIYLPRSTVNARSRWVRVQWYPRVNTIDWGSR